MLFLFVIVCGGFLYKFVNLKKKCDDINNFYREMKVIIGFKCI